MSDSPRPTNLELEVNDFGPIIAGKIDLRPLTVFVGPSNTGKSYLATLIYALHKHFSHKADRALYNMTWGAEEITSESFTLSQPMIDELTRWAKHTVDNLQDTSPIQNARSTLKCNT